MISTDPTACDARVLRGGVGDHLAQSGAEKINRIHPKPLSKISEELRQITPVSGRFRHHSIALQASIHAGFRNIAGPTHYSTGDRRRLLAAGAADDPQSGSGHRMARPILSCDNGPEYISAGLQAWAQRRGIRIEYIQPGKPQQNAYVERFNRTVRYEWLALYHLDTLTKVQDCATRWTGPSNHERLNKALGDGTAKQRQRKTCMLVVFL